MAIPEQVGAKCFAPTAAAVGATTTAMATAIEEGSTLDLGDGHQAVVFIDRANERINVDMCGGSVSLDLHLTDAHRLGIALTVCASGNAQHEVLPVDLSGRVANVYRNPHASVVYFSLRPWVLRLDVDTALQLARALRREVAYG